MVKKVLDRQPTKAITVFVDMKDVDKAAKVCSYFLHITKYMMLLCHRKSYLKTQRTKMATKDNLM